MPDFELSGPDGARYQVTAPDEAAALAAFSTLNGGGKPAPTTATDLARSAATGVPLIGGALNQLDAATNAALAPVLNPLFDEKDQLKGATFSERRAESLRQQNERDAKFSKEHPIADTAAKVAGGVGAFGGALKAVPALAGPLGFEGSMPAMITKGALSGAGISAADEAIRGGDVGEGALIGGVTGAAGGPVGRVIGKAYSGLARDRSALPVPRETIDVAGVKVPVPPVDVEAARALEAARKGSSGEAAKSLVAENDLATTRALDEATNRVAANLVDGAAPAERATSTDAARAVQEHLQGAEQTRFQTEQARAQRAALEGDQVRGNLAPDPYTGEPTIQAQTPLGAAERVSAGVARESEASQAAVDRRYDEYRATPGLYDPTIPHTMADEIRIRAARGSDPLHVDRQTSGIGGEALRILDESIGPGGLFHNEAAPRPVAGAPVAPGPAGLPPVPAPGPTDAEIAFAQLTAKGTRPERARAAVAHLPGADALPRTALEPHSVATASGGSVDLVPKVVEASAIKTSADPGYIADLQPRNRMRAASDLQIQDMAKNITPNRLGVSTEADRGAPITGPDQMVESGNGRVLALRQAYAENGAQAAKYRDWLASQGVDVSKYREPVLVRERATPMSHEERKAFTVAANQSSTLSLSGAERALADSRALSADTLGLIRNPADLAAVDNRDFVRQFMQSVPAAERASLMTASGDLSSEGLTRIRNAVMAKAYGNSSILARAAESTKDEVKSISQGLQAAAPEWAQMRAAVAAGQVPKELDATVHLLDAVERTAKIRGKGTSLAEGMAQSDAFASQSPESEAFMRLFYSADGKTAAPAGTVGNALRDYAQQANKVDASPGLLMGFEPITARDILAVTSKKIGAPQVLAKEIAEAAAKPAEEAIAGGTKGEPIPEIGVREMESARKRLSKLRGDAIGVAQRTGDESNLRVMNRIISEFDNVIRDAHAAGKFSGDSEAAQRLISEARAAHSEHKATFSKQGPRDPAGVVVEKILGRNQEIAATPEEIAKLSYGPAGEPGGGDATRVGQRLRQILGPSSHEWGAYKQGLVDYVKGDGSPAEQGRRIQKYLFNEANGQRTVKTHPGLLLSADERAALATHAENLIASEPVKLSELRGVDRVIAKISGRLDGVPSSNEEIIKFLYGGAKDAGGKSLSVVLAKRLEREMTPEAFAKVRQGLLSHVVERPEGVSEWGPKVIADNIHKFLNSSLALAMYKPAQLQEIRALGEAIKAQIPPPGATNPSGTAHMGARIMKTVGSMFLPAVGLATHGPVGALLGVAANPALTAAKNARAAREVKNLLYARPSAVPVDPRFAKASALISRGAAQGQIEGR